MSLSQANFQGEFIDGALSGCECCDLQSLLPDAAYKVCGQLQLSCGGMGAWAI